MPYIDFQKLAELEQDCGPAGRICFHSAGQSHIGHVREVNEDAFYNASELGLWAVADGMGGLARGDYASGVVIDAFVHFNTAATLAESIRDLEVRLRDAHNKCRNSFPGERVGSTVAALFCYGRYSFFLWAGDSRVYRLRKGQLKQLTTDHTVAQEKFARGELSARRAALHHSAHILTRAVGVHQSLHLDLDYQVIKPRDRYLLCSDGLYNELAKSEIQQLLTPGSVEESLQALIDGALEKGGGDNITAIVVEAG